MTEISKTSIEYELFKTGSDFLVFHKPILGVDSNEELSQSAVEVNENKKTETDTLELNQSSVSIDEEGIETSNESETKSIDDIKSGIRELQGLIDSDQSPKPNSTSREIPNATPENAVTSERLFLLDSGENSPWVLDEKYSGESLEVLFVGDTEVESSLENRAFEGEQYKLLYRLINALGYQKGEVAFCAMIEPEAKSLNESNNLISFFKKVKVKNIVTLGALPLKFFGVSDKRLSSVHGESFKFSHGEDVINLIPIFHPSYLLVNPNMKKRVWDDLQIIKK